MELTISPILIKNATFGYSEKPVFENVSLSIEHGEIFCLMGRNGCGKSTLIDALFDINHLSSGEIEIMGKNLKEYSPSTLAEQISYVPQIHDKSFPYTVRQIILMGRTIYTRHFGLYSSYDHEIVQKTMEKIGITGLADRPYTQLSGGEMQMVMLARALVQETEIIVMDEPTAHLDYYNELLFLEQVIDLVRTEKKTIIMATHSPNQPFFLEQTGLPIRVGLMKDGHIPITGSPTEVLTKENIQSVYNIESQVIHSDYQSVLLPRQTVSLKHESSGI